MSLFVDKALAELNPAIPIGQIAASLPPARTISASPLLIMCNPCPIESAAEAHAETVEKFGPLVPSIIETWPEAMSESIIGTRKGLILEGPFSDKTLN